MRKILLFGGSFDPIHHGHLIISRYAAEHLGIPQVILIPSATPPHKRNHGLAPIADRQAMCGLAVADDPQFAVSDWESDRAGPNYTIDTVSHFLAVCGPTARIYWLVGLDSLHELGTWHRAPELLDACAIVTAARPGFPPPDWPALTKHFSARQLEQLQQHVVAGPRIDIASTEIRARVRAGQSIRFLVPEAVRRYIADRGLYRGN